jgi:NTP pyrophosphatase (non-canonical NTP hydrolase)
LADHSTEPNKRNAETLKELIGLFDGPEQRAVVVAEVKRGEHTLNEFQQLASRTLPAPTAQHFFQHPTPLGAQVHPGSMAEMQEYQHAKAIDLIHAVFGIAGEAGELCDPVKKAMFYGKPLDEANIREEAGDLLWYIAAPLCRALGCTLEELAAANVAKLRQRYPEIYTDAAAIARADKGESPQDAPKPAAVTAGMRLRPLTDEAKAEIIQKYAPQAVDFGDGYFWDADARSWQLCPELWEALPPCFAK